MAGGVINRRQLISIATGVGRANNPNHLKEYGGHLVLTDKWARIVDWYNHVIKEKEIIVRGFNSAGISEAVQNAEDIYEKI